MILYTSLALMFTYWTSVKPLEFQQE